MFENVFAALAKWIRLYRDFVGNLYTSIWVYGWIPHLWRNVQQTAAYESMGNSHSSSHTAFVKQFERASLQQSRVLVGILSQIYIYVRWDWGLTENYFVSLLIFVWLDVRLSRLEKAQLMSDWCCVWKRLVVFQCASLSWLALWQNFTLCWATEM